MNHIFWISTLIPGFALLELVSKRETQRGFLGTLAWSFVLTITVMTPVMVVAHLLHLSTPAVACVYAALVILGVLVVIKQFSWSRFSSSLQNVYWPELSVILAVIAVGAGLGGIATYDSWVYAAKIRYLEDVGFSLQDPYSPLQVSESRYLINSYFGIQAIGSWLTATEPIEMLFDSAWFFRLLELGGIEFLALSLFRTRWVATTSVLGALFFIGSESAAAHPKYLAAFIVFPILFACVLDVLERPTALRYLKIGATSLAMAVIHVGFFLMVIICLFPALAFWYLLRHRLPNSCRVAVLTGAALLLPGVPFLVMIAIQPTPNWELWDSWFTFSLHTFRIGEVWELHMLKPTSYFWMAPTAAVVALLLFVHKNSTERMGFVATVLLTAILFMFNPVFLTMLMQHIPYWIVERAQYIGQVVALVSIPGWLAMIAADSLGTRRVRLLFSAAVIVGGMSLFRPLIADFYNDSEKQRYMLQRAHELRETLASVDEERPLIAADSTLSLILPAVRLSAVMAPYLTHSNPADRGVIQRHDDAQELFSHSTSDERRKAISTKYGIDYVLIGSHRGRGANERELDQSELAFEGLIVERHQFRLFKLGS